MPDTRVDAELIAAHLAGDSAGLAAIYDRYADSLYDTAAAMLGDRHEAADVMQEVFLTAAEKLDQLRDPGRLKPWLFAVLRHQVYRRTKRRKRAMATDFSGSEAADMTATIDPLAEAGQVAADDLASALRTAALGLDDRDQLVLELTSRQGLSGADLADALGVTVEQSYVLLHRMRDRVQRSLGALTVARMGRDDCDDLARMLSDWDGRFSVLIRKRVARHIDDCERCDESSRRFAVLSLIGAAPLLATPADLRDRVLRTASTRKVGTVDTPSMRWDHASGFPIGGNSRRWLPIVAAMVTVAAIAVGLLVWFAAANGDAPVADAVTPTTGMTTTTNDNVAAVVATPAPSFAAPTTPTATAPPTDNGPQIMPPATVAPPTLVPSPSPPATNAPATLPPVPPTAPPTAPPTTVDPGPPPSVTLVAQPSVAPCGPPGGEIRVAVTGGSPITSVVLTWSGPGSPGSTPMSPGDGNWVGFLVADAGGFWNYQVTATDSVGRTGSIGSELLAVGC